MVVFPGTPLKPVLESAMAKVKAILDTTREPCLLKDVMHKYEDKYDLVEKAGTASLESLFFIFKLLGITDATFERLVSFPENTALTLRFEASQQCRFVKKIEREKQKGTTRKFTGDINLESRKFDVVTEYFWELLLQYKLFIFTGSDPKKTPLDLLNGTIKCDEVVTKTEKPPTPESQTIRVPDADITDMLSFLNNAREVQFKIDRTAEDCYTPSQNGEVKKLKSLIARIQGTVLEISLALNGFASTCGQDISYENEIERVISSVFIPVVPFMDKSKPDEEAKTFSFEDQQKFVEEFQRSLTSALEGLEETLQNLIDVKSKEVKVLGFAEYRLLALSNSISKVEAGMSYTIETVEQELRRQIIQAVGKECTTDDLTKYMKFHYSKIYKAEYAPKAFSHDVRRMGFGFSPEGAINLEQNKNIIYSCCRKREADDPNAPKLKFALNASTDVRFRGKQYLHGIVLHKFSNETVNCDLFARARQFSSFIMMIGTITHVDRFEPHHGIVIQNKDELKIPLACTVLPSAKEFRDAIQSLSPEQQRFARAFREMQIQSTLFAILVVPIKPLIEQLLNLSYGSLTKEIRLTQDLMRLFIEYQVPSDLLTFTGPSSTSQEEKLDSVRGYTKSLLKMIEEARAAELKQIEETADAKVMKGVGEIFDVDDDIVQPLERFTKQSMRMDSVPRAGTGRATMRAFSAMPPASAMQMNIVKGQGQDMAKVQEAQVEEIPVETEGQKMDVDQIDEEEVYDKRVANYTRIPKHLDSTFETLKGGDKIRPTTFRPGKIWKRKRQPGLLFGMKNEFLDETKQAKEKNETMDLVDALSRSGELELVDTSLHIIVGMTQCFDETLMDTLVLKNRNPIELIEGNNVVMNSIIQNEGPENLLLPKSFENIQKLSPHIVKNIKNA